MVRQLRYGFLFISLCITNLLTESALGQQAQSEKQDVRTRIQAYREFLIQAEQALPSSDKEQTARDILDVCPKHLRHFEWHYLYRKAQHASLTLKGHTDVVRTVAFSPNNKVLVSGSDDGSAKIWDLNAGKLLHTIKGQGWGVHSMAFHPNGKTFVSGGWNRAVKLWDVETGKNLATLSKHDSMVLAVGISPDGAWLAALTSTNIIHILDFAKSEPKTVMDQRNRLYTCFAFSKDGTYLATGQDNGGISLWRLPDFRYVRELVRHQETVMDLAFHPDGKRLISAGMDGIRIWDIEEGKVIKSVTPPQEPYIHALALNSQGTALATVGASKVKLWYEPLDKPTRDFSLPRQRKFPFLDKSFVTFAPNGQTLAVEGPDFTIRLIDTAEQTLEIQAVEPIWSVHPAKDHFLVSMRKGAAAISISPDGTYRQRDLKNHKGQVRSICYQPEGNLMASAGVDRTIKIIDRRSEKELHSLPGHQGLIRQLAFSPDGKRLASASEDMTVKIWDPVAGKELLTLKGHKGSVNSVVFSSKDQLISAGGDGAIVFWHAETGKILQTLKAHDDWINGLALSADGKRLASAGLDKKIKIWETTGKLHQTISAHTSMVQALAFSPDGKRLASGNMGGGVTLWDPVAGQEIYTFPRLTGPINAVAFSPDGSTLFSGSYDGTIMLWKARPSE